METVVVVVIVAAVFFAIFRLVLWIGNTWLIGREALRDNTDADD